MDLISISIFFLGCFLFSYIEKKNKIPFAKWIFIIPFCFLIMNRSMDVPDTEIYVDYLLSESTSLSYYHESGYGFEVGFQAFTKLVKIVFDENYKIYFAIITLINLLLIDNSIKRIYRLFKKESIIGVSDIKASLLVDSPDYSIIPLTLYIAFFGLYFNAIVLRVGIAFSLIILAASFSAKPDKKIFDYILVILLITLATLFHSTALIGIIIILIILFSKKISFKSYFIISLIIGVVYFSNLTSRLGSTVFNFIASLNNLTLLSEKLNNYGGESVFTAEGISMKFVFFWLMSFVLLFNDTQSKIYYKLFNVYLLGLAVFALMRRVLFVERVTDYFLLFSFVLFYLYLIRQSNIKFWMYYVGIVLVQIVFVMRIINREMV